MKSASVFSYFLISCAVLKICCAPAPKDTYALENGKVLHCTFPWREYCDWDHRRHTYCKSCSLLDFEDPKISSYIHQLRSSSTSSSTLPPIHEEEKIKPTLDEVKAEEKSEENFDDSTVDTSEEQKTSHKDERNQIYLSGAKNNGDQSVNAKVETLFEKIDVNNYQEDTFNGRANDVDVSANHSGDQIAEASANVETKLGEFEVNNYQNYSSTGSDNNITVNNSANSQISINNVGVSLTVLVIYHSASVYIACRFSISISTSA